ncbi:MAG: 3-oxoacid CoA-transferase subunit B [Paracoccaceae bacterium]
MSGDLSMALSRKQMAWRAAQDISDGAYVNLGIGLPTLCSGYLPKGRLVTFQSENGILGFGGPPPKGEEDYDLINASKGAITILPGASIVHHGDSFAMIRGGHIDIAVLGAFEVANNGDLANWSPGPGGVPGVGGAMDLASGARAVWVVTTHVTKSGAPKLVERCALPLTGAKVVKRVYTDLAVIDVTEAGFVLRELSPEVSVDRIREMTGAPLLLEGEPAPLKAPAGL